jgi:PHD/YefM family antitoxin component YafN of YafNO toxin-antitoxin module
MPILKDMQVQYITNESGERSSVILSIEDFESLLEDLEDLAIIAKRRDEPTITHENLKKELKKDGLLPD